MPRCLVLPFQNLFRTFSTSTKTMAPIERITLFKIPNEADRQRVLEQYKVLAKTATKVFLPPRLLNSNQSHYCNDITASPELLNDYSFGFCRTENLTSSPLQSANPSMTRATRVSTSLLRQPSPPWKI